MLGYYDDEQEYYNDENIPDRMGKGSTLRDFMKDGKINIVNGKNRIYESIEDILSSDGSRFFCPQYNSRIKEMLFEQSDDLTKDVIMEYCRQALEKWEPRITVVSLSSEVEPTKINVRIDYIIKDIGTPDSYVYTVERKIPSL